LRVCQSTQVLTGEVFNILLVTLDVVLAQR